ncbi:pirin family protein [Novosphingobium lentum]|uniref:pirin family protein n=1 Tax=Novosphingobium lentum TaxID=145287 RepID=UPI0008300CFE|nr:pirin family protein [Novosphingobium lentum]
MIDIRPFAGLGHADHGWLDARHHFSFADYRDPARMGWGSIRVWNDDTIGPRSGFPPHPHRDMEIVTFVRSGAITHRDSLGNEGRTGAGDVQVMSAGTGITHAEFNLEPDATTLFQIWIMPDRNGEQPSWGQREFPSADRAGRWVTLAAGDGQGEVLPLRADARVMAARIAHGEKLALTIDPARHIYLVSQVGAILVNGIPAAARDGVAITGEDRIEIHAVDDAEIVLVDAR